MPAQGLNPVETLTHTPESRSTQARVVIGNINTYRNMEFEFTCFYIGIVNIKPQTDIAANNFNDLKQKM